MFKKLTLLAALSAASFATVAEPVTYTMDPDHTDVIASWSHFGFSNPIAHFGQVDGTITYDPDNVGASSVQVTIPLSGLDSHVKAFDEHLRSGDFFDAANHPEITFSSTGVEAAGEDRLKVAGDLTLRGTTRPVVLDVTINRVGTQPMSGQPARSEEHTSELQSRPHLVCRLLLEKKKKQKK